MVEASWDFGQQKCLGIEPKLPVRNPNYVHTVNVQNPNFRLKKPNTNLQFVRFKKLHCFSYMYIHNYVCFIKRSSLVELSEIGTFGLVLVDNGTSEIGTV